MAISEGGGLKKGSIMMVHCTYISCYLRHTWSQWGLVKLWNLS